MSISRRSLCIFLTIFCGLTSLDSHAEVLWDNWYTVTDGGKPESYYNEKAEIIQDKAKIQVNTWTRTETGTKVENLGATAKNTPLLEPLLYNFRSTEGSNEKTIDGSIISNGKVFSVKVKHGQQPAGKALRAEMLPKLILASFFPIWVHKNYKRITGVQPIEFQAIVEDQVEETVPVIKGTAYEMLPDDFSKKTKTRKIRIEFNKLVAFWYITPKGDSVRISIPTINKMVDKVDHDTAQKFLTSK